MPKCRSASEASTECTNRQSSKESDVATTSSGFAPCEIATTARESSKSNMRKSIHQITEALELETDEVVRAGILPGQRFVSEVYAHPFVQITVALLIACNFMTSAVQAEVHRDVTPGSSAELVFFGFELFFNIAFSLELLVNIYANWFFEFWMSAWNVFDFVIVIISMLSMGLKNLPGISVLRLFRAFRVFRLFKRIKSLRVIIEAVLKSIPGVMNAFVILTLIMGIWSIMSVEFFGKRMPDHFGTWSKAMLTFFQIMTLDGWCTTIVRPLVCSGEAREADGLYYNCEEVDLACAFFFLSYLLINGVMMVNVVVAILLDKFIREMTSLREEQADAALKAVEAEAQAEAGDVADADAAQSSLRSGANALEVGPVSSLDSESDPNLQAKQELLNFEAEALKRLREIKGSLALMARSLGGPEAEAEALQFWQNAPAMPQGSQNEG